MTIYYSYLSSLLFLLLITELVNSASLRSYLQSSSNRSLKKQAAPFVVNKSLVTSEPILIRRRPLLSSNENQRRKRWTKEEDNDEVEIPIDENIHEQSINNIIDTSTTVFENDLVSLNSTISTEQSTINTPEKNSDENSKVTSYPLLRQDLLEINETNQLTTVSMENNTNYVTTINVVLPLTTSNENIDINPTESEIGSTNVTDINQVISNEKNESISNTIDNLTTSKIISNDGTTSSQIEVSTVSRLDSDTSIVPSSDTTIVSGEINDNQTSIDSGTTIVSEYKTTMMDEIKNTTIIFSVTQTETMVTTIDVSQELVGDITTNSEGIFYDTSTIINEDEYSNETSNSLPQPTPKPICDFSCECSKKCPYGYEVINDQCECDPPCKNYKCYGDDMCNVTSEGKPVCLPTNGTEHDRPIRCFQPRDAGYHDINIRYHDRWYYDPNSAACHLFLYRGSGGNENNFETLHKCNLECITCALEPDRGPCLGHLLMWHFDFKKNECSQFGYSGCKGNENKFIRKQDCIDTCVTRVLNI